MTKILLRLNLALGLQSELKIKIYNHFKLQFRLLNLLTRKGSGVFAVRFSLLKLRILRTVSVRCCQCAPLTPTSLPLGLKQAC